MRAVVQRVSSARVRVGDEVVAEIGAGLMALVGVGFSDREEDSDELARKLIHLRIFEDDEGRMNRSLLDTGGALLVVSQFTLYGDTRRGRRPYFGAAADPERAAPLIERVVEGARREGLEVANGRFGAQMKVSLVNEGPVTLLLDTEKLF